MLSIERGRGSQGRKENRKWLTRKSLRIPSSEWENVSACHDGTPGWEIHDNSSFKHYICVYYMLTYIWKWKKHINYKSSKLWLGLSKSHKNETDGLQHLPSSTRSLKENRTAPVPLRAMHTCSIYMLFVLQDSIRVNVTTLKDDGEVSNAQVRVLWIMPLGYHSGVL